MSLRDPEPLIIELPEPPRDAGHKESHADLSRLLDRLSRRIVRVLEQRGLLIADPVDPYLEYEPG